MKQGESLFFVHTKSNNIIGHFLILYFGGPYSGQLNVLVIILLATKLSYSCTNIIFLCMVTS